VIYTPTIQLRHRRPLSLAQGCSALEAEALVRQVQVLLFQKPARNKSAGDKSVRDKPAGDLVLSDTPQPIHQDIFQGRRGRYSTTHTPQIPPSEYPKVQATGLELRRLGCEYLGDLQLSKVLGLVIYGFITANHHSYGLIYRYGNYRGVEFFSKFASGSSLTTTSRGAWFLNFGLPTTYFRCHWGYDAKRLYQCHRQHRQRVQREQGDGETLMPSLVGLAETIDAHLSDRRGLLLTL
jgi:hypothetical protein